jgi:hypothetical protein
MSSLLFFVCIVGTMQLVVGQQVEAVNPPSASNITSWTPVVLMHGTSHFLIIILFTYLLNWYFILLILLIYLLFCLFNFI